MKFLNTFQKSIFFLFLLFLLTCCADSQNAFRMSAESPDEFAVIRKEPLTLPPDFNLRPPGEDQTSRTSKFSSEKAKSTIVSIEASGSSREIKKMVISKGEEAFLQQSGVKLHNSSIRKILQEENTQIATFSNDFIDRLVSRVTGTRNNDNVLKPGVEQKRIQAKLSVDGTGVQGQEPVIIRRRRESTLSRIF